MKMDLTIKITPKMVTDAQGNEKKALVGHLGTHFDVMNKEFPLEYTERKGIVFDVSGIKDRDIDCADIDLQKVKKDMFVSFYTGFIEEEGYGSRKYFTEHPQLSNALLEALLEKKVSIIGVDFAGVRRGKEHTPHGSALCGSRRFYYRKFMFLASDFRAWRELSCPYLSDELCGNDGTALSSDCGDLEK